MGAEPRGLGWSSRGERGSHLGGGDKELRVGTAGHPCAGCVLEPPCSQRPGPREQNPGVRAPRPLFPSWATRWRHPRLDPPPSPSWGRRGRPLPARARIGPPGAAPCPVPPPGSHAQECRVFPAAAPSSPPAPSPTDSGGAWGGNTGPGRSSSRGQRRHVGGMSGGGCPCSGRLGRVCACVPGSFVCVCLSVCPGRPGPVCVCRTLPVPGAGPGRARGM